MPHEAIRGPFLIERCRRLPPSEPEILETVYVVARCTTWDEALRTVRALRADNPATPYRLALEGVTTAGAAA